MESHNASPKLTTKHAKKLLEISMQVSTCVCLVEPDRQPWLNLSLCKVTQKLPEQRDKNSPLQNKKDLLVEWLLGSAWSVFWQCSVYSQGVNLNPVASLCEGHTQRHVFYPRCAHFLLQHIPKSIGYLLGEIHPHAYMCLQDKYNDLFTVLQISVLSVCLPCVLQVELVSLLFKGVIGAWQTFSVYKKENKENQVLKV